MCPVTRDGDFVCVTKIYILISYINIDLRIRTKLNLTNIIPENEDSLKRLKALTDPLRLRLFYFFSERHTVKEAAQALGVKPNALYHHLSVLKKVGLVEVVDKKKIRNLTTNFYQAKKDIEINRHKMTDPGPKAPFFDAIKSIAWSTYEDCTRELASAPHKKAFAGRSFIKIKKDKLDDLPKKIAAASKEFLIKLEAMGDEDGDVRYSVTIVEFEMSD